MRFFILLMITTLGLFAIAPTWYAQQTLLSQGSTYYGYGEDEDQTTAIIQAKEMIAAEVSTKIVSELESKSERQGDSGSTHVSATLKATTNVDLFGASVEKKEQVDGRWFVLVKYELLSIEERAKRALANVSCDEKGYDYLSKTPLIQKISDYVGCEHRYTLWRQNRSWYLKYNDFKAPLSFNEFDGLFKSVYNPNIIISVKPNKMTLIEDDVFSFTLLSKKKALVSLLSVYEDGRVGVLLSNKSVLAHEAVTFPSKEASFEMVAGLVHAGLATKDLYVAIISEKPIDTTRFESVSDTLIERQSEYKFFELIKLMQEVEYTSLLLRTLPKH